jgi:hypothetical protein
MSRNPLGPQRQLSPHERRMSIHFQWRWLIGLRRAPPTVTAAGDLLHGDAELARCVARSCLEWALRRKEPDHASE